MKEIKIFCDHYGRIKTDSLSTLLSNENERIKVIVEFGDNELKSYRKRIDIYVANDQTFDFYEQDVERVLTFELKKQHLKQGQLKIQPIAYLVEQGKTYLQSIKQKWIPFTVDIRYSINASESTTIIDITLGEQLQNELDLVADELEAINLKLDDIGDVEDLQTTNKTIVGAINELLALINT